MSYAKRFDWNFLWTILRIATIFIIGHREKFKGWIKNWHLFPICMWFSATKFNSNSHSDPLFGVEVCFCHFSAQKSNKKSSAVWSVWKKKKIEEKKKEKKENWKLRKSYSWKDLSDCNDTGQGVSFIEVKLV